MDSHLKNWKIKTRQRGEKNSAPREQEMWRKDEGKSGGNNRKFGWMRGTEGRDVITLK